MHTPEYLVVILLAIVSASFDWKKRIIPNWLTFGGISIGFLLSIFHGTLGVMLIGFCAACLLFFPYKRGWLGGGDVKLLMAYALLLGPWHLLDLWLGAALLSIPLALGMAQLTNCSWRCVGIPYAVPLAFVALFIIGRGMLYS